MYMYYIRERKMLISEIYSVHVCFSQFQHLDSDGLRLDTDSLLSEPIFVPVKFDAVAAAVQDNLHNSSDSEESLCTYCTNIHTYF